MRGADVGTTTGRRVGGASGAGVGSPGLYPRTGRLIAASSVRTSVACGEGPSIHATRRCGSSAPGVSVSTGTARIAMPAPSPTKKCEAATKWHCVVTQSVPSPRFEQPVLNNPERHLRARAEPESVQHALDVVLGGPLAHHQALGDLAIAESLCHQ